MKLIFKLKNLEISSVSSHKMATRVQEKQYFRFKRTENQTSINPSPDFLKIYNSPRDGLVERTEPEMAQIDA